MERKIGEIFIYNGKKLQCVEDHLDICDRCYYFNRYGCNDKHIRGECSKNLRKDHKSIIFVELKEEVKMDKQKELTISIPDGYEIDEDLSSFDKIIFKKKEHQIKTWSDLIGEKIPKGSVYISGTSQIKEENDDLLFWKDSEKNIFIDKRHAKAALAMAQISQLMPYYGEAITDEEWHNMNIPKYSLRRHDNKVIKKYAFTIFRISFFSHSRTKRLLLYK